MKDEIKEILDKLQKVANCETASRNALMEIKDKDYQLLLDYITNLQEEVKSANESITWWVNRFNALQEENKRLSIELNKNMIERNNYLSRNEKAIKMFNNETLNKYYYGMSYEFEINDFKEDMLNILQGSDDK